MSQVSDEDPFDEPEGPLWVHAGGRWWNLDDADQLAEFAKLHPGAAIDPSKPVGITTHREPY